MRVSGRTSWPAVGLFLLTRLAVWCVAVLTVLVAPDHLGDQAGQWGAVDVHLPGALTDVWRRWDAGWYERIASSGYHWPSATPAFFPLLPALMAPLGRLLAGQYALAGVLVSLAAGAMAATGIEQLGRRHLDPASAWRAVVLLCVFPTSVFLGAPYGESLFLALAVGTFLLAERDRLAAAAVVTGLALLVRPQGAAVAAALAVVLWQRRGARGLLLLAIPAALFAVFPALLWVWIDRPLAFLQAQEQWERSLSPLGPVGGIVQGVREGDLLGLAAVAAFAALAVVAWRSLGTAYGVYAVSALAIPLSLPSARLGGLYSFPRFALVVFPCFLALGLLTRGRRALFVALVAASAVGLAACTARFALWEWVA